MKNPDERFQSFEEVNEVLHKINLDTGREVSELPYKTSKFNKKENPYIGRDKEKNFLITEWEKVKEGKVSVISIAGFAGVGKTRLAHQLRDRVWHDGGDFIEGKFDQGKGHTPYASLIKTFQDHIPFMIIDRMDTVSNFKEKLIGKMGKNANLMCHMIPELESILNIKKNTHFELEDDTKHRFQLTFLKFVDAFLNKPVVVFIDDLHWSDHASISLIQSLIIGKNMKNLMFLFCYRPDELIDSHPFRNLLKEYIPVSNQIIISELSETEVQEWLRTELLISDKDLLRASKIIKAKSSGNPLFLERFLINANDLGLLKRVGGNFEIDFRQLEESFISDNIIEFLIALMKRLNASAQKLLKAASSIGNDFELSLLNEVVDGIDEIEFKALKDKFYFIEIPSSNKGSIVCKFSHDRIQQSAILLMNEDENKYYQLKVIQSLEAELLKKKNDEVPFQLSDYICDCPIEWIPSEKRRQWSSYCYQNSHRSLASGAFDQAHKYLKQAISIYSDWQNYAETLNKHKKVHVLIFYSKK